MKYKIVSDSSSNILSFSKVPYATVPLKTITSEKEYVDNEALDVSRMVAELKTKKERALRIKPFCSLFSVCKGRSVF